MIIGISGKMGAGKDLVGLGFQYLTSEYRDTYEFADWHDRVTKYASDPHSRFSIQKFGGKLKDVVCILIGCTREQLESQEFKRTELGEEWRVWYGINYKMSTNKKEGRVTSLFPSLEEYETAMEGHIGKKLVTSIESRLLTPRLILQLMGTEAGRYIIHPNIWVNSLMAEYVLDKGVVTEPISKEVKSKYPTGSAPDMQQYHREPKFPDWIITDVRFPNEARAVKDKGGIVLRINRPQLAYSKAKQLREHDSETGLDDYDGFDAIIDNSGSVYELLSKIKPFI